MGQIPYKPIPHDSMGTDLQEFAVPYPALVITNSENNTTSSLITLNDNTTSLEVHAVGGAAAIRWVSASTVSGLGNTSVVSAAAGANFDGMIPANYFRRFAVPQATIGINSVVGLNKQAGLYNAVAVKSVGIASVATLQF